MNWKKITDEVLYPINSNKPVTISRGDIENLKDIAQSNRRHRARFCAHFSVEDDVQEMVIYHEKDTYIRPHKHLMKTESYLLLEGKIDVVLFNDNGKPLDVIEMGDSNTDKTFFFRMPQPMYRTLILKQDSVFLEVKQGPFNLDHVQWAKWAPHHEEIDKVKKYLDQLSLSIKEFVTQ